MDVPAAGENALKGNHDHGICTHKTVDGRNLIVCIDGTSNQFGEKNTNVIEMYNRIFKETEDNQRTWYNSGIGTYARPSWRSLSYYKTALWHKIDLAIAWNFEATIIAAYRWLSDNYEKGDCIFLFGFSRGAYQVRALSAMIDKVGLIHKGNEAQIPFAYELYADPKSGEAKAATVGHGSKKTIPMAERFKGAFSRKGVKVHFVGAWDTVSSIGLARGNHMLPGTIDGMKHVCYFRHALALDERRVKFLPEFAYGGSTLPPKSIDHDSFASTTKGLDRVPEKSEPEKVDESDGSVADEIDTAKKGSVEPVHLRTKKPPHTLEVWFPGTHSDIMSSGGGNALNMEMDRGRPPLRWILLEAGAVGLRTAPFEKELSGEEQIEVQESLTGVWWILELLPVKRLTFSRRTDGRHAVTRKPHLGSSRKIHDGQKIHSSLLLEKRSKWGKEYIPRAHGFPDTTPSFWRELRKAGFKSPWLELDLNDQIRTILQRLASGSEPDRAVLGTLRQLAVSVDGRQIVYDEVIEALRKEDPAPTSEVKYQILQILLNVIDDAGKDGSQLQIRRLEQIRPLVSDLLEPGKWDYNDIARTFLLKFTDTCLLEMRHPDSVYSATFSPNGLRIISCSHLGVYTWDAMTGKAIGKPLRGHRDVIRSVAVSPDGKFIASGSDDRTVRVWDAKTGDPVGTPFTGHSDSVMSVAFSPDGKHLASSSGGRTAFVPGSVLLTSPFQRGSIFIQETETGRVVWQEPEMEGTILSIAFSPDGQKFVSGSSMGTLRVWSTATGQLIGEPIKAHADYIRSVAFASDSRRVASGSDDRSIRIWDTATGRAVGERLTGHTDYVCSIAFSPDGRLLASGSYDSTIRLWDVATGGPLGASPRRHINYVLSVAFSPDGKTLVSGSKDGCLRTWAITEFV